MGIPQYHQVAERYAEEISALARDLVRIDTTNTGIMPTGSETEAATLLERVFRSAGISAAIDGRVQERGNLFASLEGASGRPGLLLISHLDVVPPGDLRQWAHPPFEGVIDDGHLFGRGAADMKGTAAAQVMALVLLSRLKVPLPRTVGLVCVADEEAGGAYGMRWVAREHPEWLRAAYCLNEGGGFFTRMNGHTWCLLGVGEKARFEAVATFRGRGAHAARPWQGENALVPAASAIGRLHAYEPERDVRDPIFGHLERLVGPMTPESVDAVIARLRRDSPRLADHLQQVSRMLVTPTMISAGVKSNSVPDACRLVCDVRALPHQGAAEVESVVRRLMPDADLAMTQTAVANTSPASDSFLSSLGETLRRVVDASIDVVPTVTGGFTDSRFLRELGVPAYGFSPGHPDSDPSRHRAHGPNESVAVRDLVVQTAVYMELAAWGDGSG